MLKGYSLDQLESNWPESVFDEAEVLLKKLDKRKLRKLPAGLYTLEFQPDLETEVVIKANRVQSSTCDCEGYRKTGKCSHILAHLILVRRSKTKPKPKKKKPSAIPRVTVPAILDTIENDDLKYFIREYARQNKPLSLLLKTRFIRSVKTEEDEEKYDKLLSQIIRIGNNGKVQLTTENKKVLLKMFEGLLMHVVEAMTFKQFREAFVILRTILKKLHMVVDHQEVYANYYEETYLKIYEILQKFLELQLPPELIRQAVDFGIDLGSRRSYHLFDFERNVYAALILSAPYKTLAQKAFKEIDQRIDLQNESVGAKWMALSLFLRAKINDSKLKSAYPNASEMQWSEAVRMLRTQEKHESLIWIHENKDFTGFRDKAQAQIKKNLLMAAQVLEHESAKIDLSIELSILETKILYFTKLLSEYPGEKVYAQMENSIKTRLDGGVKNEMLAQFYISMNEPEKLLELLYEISNIEFTITHDQILFPHKSKEVTDLYFKMISTQLEQYAGQKNIETLNRWRNHYMQLGEKNQINLLLSRLKTQFKEREFLLSQLGN